jgi:ATP-dependent Clp protease ATP-binding subunit ClpA
MLAALSTPRCQQIIRLSRSACRRLGSPYISSGHLLLALSLDRGGVGEAFREAGLTVDRVSEHLRQCLDWPEQTTEEGGILIGQSAIVAFDRAQAKASVGRPPDIRVNFVGLRHLILALLDEESGTAADILNRFCVERSKIRQALAHGS